MGKPAEKRVSSLIISSSITTNQSHSNRVTSRTNQSSRGRAHWQHGFNAPIDSHTTETNSNTALRSFTRHAVQLRPTTSFFFHDNCERINRAGKSPRRYLGWVLRVQVMRVQDTTSAFSATRNLLLALLVNLCVSVLQ